MPSISGGPPALARRLVAALVVPAVAYALYATGQQAMEGRRMTQQVADLQRSVDGLQAENVRLQNELSFRRSDDYVEMVAREQLGLVMPGDTAVDLVGDALPASSGPVADPGPASAAPPAAPQRGRPADAWFAYFFGG